MAIDPNATGRQLLVREYLTRLMNALATYAFVARNEEDLQGQVIRAIAASDLGISTIESEVVSTSGRYDILLQDRLGISIVLELKVKGSAGEVERQAQRYAKTAGIDAVAIVTTSSRLAGQIKRGELVGKPFEVIALRSAI
jgi:hypothetical protein